MKRSLAAFSILLALLSSSCSTTHFSVLPRAGKFDPDGEIAVSGDAGTIGLDATNSVEALGLVEDDGVPGIRGDVDWGVACLTLAWQQSENGGTGTLEAEISDDDTTIAAGTDIESVFDFGLGEALVTFDVIPGDTFELGLGLGAAVFDLDVSVTDLLTGEVVDPEQETFAAPLLAVRAGVQVWRLDVQALLGGIDFSYDGDSASLYDLDAFVRLSLFGRADRSGHGALVLGYRLFDLDVEYDDEEGSGSVDADVSFDGPYAALSLGL
jgi:hypothetical protein